MTNTFYKDKNVLVTGGAGFIGSHLVEALVRAGAAVTVLDNFSTGKEENLSHLMNAITVIHGDIRNPLDCEQATENKSHVFHCAAFVSVPQSVAEPALCEAINTQGTLNLLTAAAQNKVAHFVFSSSSAVYGNQEGTCSETSPLNPQSPYAESKKRGEELCSLFAERYGISTASLRYFNVNGPRQNPYGDYAAVVARFKEKLIRHEPIIIYGDGLQTRDFVPVEEVVRANLTAGMALNMQGEVFNVASGTSITLLELLRRLEIELKIAPVDIMLLPERPGDIKHSHADCQKYWDFKEAVAQATLPLSYGHYRTERREKQDVHEHQTLH